MLGTWEAVWGIKTKPSAVSSCKYVRPILKFMTPKAPGHSRCCMIWCCENLICCVLSYWNYCSFQNSSLIKLPLAKICHYFPFHSGTSPAFHFLRWHAPATRKQLLEVHSAQFYCIMFHSKWSHIFLIQKDFVCWSIVPMQPQLECTECWIWPLTAPWNPIVSTSHSANLISDWLSSWLTANGCCGSNN